jgi:hypothetical protein
MGQSTCAVGLREGLRTRTRSKGKPAFPVFLCSGRFSLRSCDIILYVFIKAARRMGLQII